MHPLHPGATSAAAGLSSEIGLEAVQPDASSTSSAATVHTLAVAPGVAPFVAARVGLPGDNEGGITYAGQRFGPTHGTCSSGTTAR